MKNNIKQILEQETLQYFDEFTYFKKSLWETLMQVEGGAKLVKLIGDSGGWTKYGIAYNYNKDKFNSLEDFKGLTEYEAMLIGFNTYYIGSGTQYISPGAKDVYFDIAFNMGVRRAIKMAQKILGIQKDGIVGAITKNRFADITEDELTKERVKYYYSLTHLKHFLKGWLNRVRIISNID